MTMLVKPRFVAPDSSHWAGWIDAALSPDPALRKMARSFHEELLARNRVPTLSFHNLTELLAIEDRRYAEDRVAFLMSLPLVGYIKGAGTGPGLGTIVDVVAAEADAALQGHATPKAIRDAAKSRLLHTGTGADALGDQTWVWSAVWPLVRSQAQKAQDVAALGPLRMFDDSKTVGQIIAEGRIARPEEMKRQMNAVRNAVMDTIKMHGDRRIIDHEAIADRFMFSIYDLATGKLNSVRDLVVMSLVAQGVEEEEIRDQCILKDLLDLATWRTELRIAARQSGSSFDQLKSVSPHNLPHHIIKTALDRFGQKRMERPGSDVTDRHLGTISAYVDELFVDKRTWEDFRRAKAKERRLEALIGEIKKASSFTALLGSQ